MAEIDTSSYKPFNPPNVVDQMQKWQSLARGQTALESDKLNLLNTRYNYMIKALSALPDNATQDDYVKTGQHFVKMGFVPPDMYAQFIKGMPTDPKQLPQYKNYITRMLLDNQAMYNVQRPQPQFVNRGGDLLPVTASSEQPPQQAGPPIKLGLSPGQAESPVTVNEGGVQKTMPQQGFSERTGGGQPLPPQALPVNPRLNPNGLPVAPLPPQRPASAPEPNVWGPPPIQSNPGASNGMPVTPPQQTAQSAIPQGRGEIVGSPPLYEEGKAAYTKAQADSANLLANAKQVTDVFPLLNGMTTGPLTDKVNTLKAIASNLGIGFTNEATAYQEANKALLRYIRGAGGQTDLDRMNISESSPNMSQQINPALMNIARKSVSYDRMKALIPQAFNAAFQGKEPSYNQYGQFASDFQNRIDPRALVKDLYSPKEWNSLIEEAKKNKNTPEGRKFIDTLMIAKNVGLYGQ